MHRHINVRGIIINDRGELFCQRLTARTGDGRDFWCTPGGGLELGESVLDGLRREMIEETGVEPVIGRLLFVQQFAIAAPAADEPREQLEFLFHITNWQDYQSIDLAATTHGLAEVAECGFISPQQYPILPHFLAEVDLAQLIARNQPVQCLSSLA